MRRSRAAARSPCLAVALVNSISAIWRFSPWPRASVLVSSACADARSSRCCLACWSSASTSKRGTMPRSSRLLVSASLRSVSARPMRAVATAPCAAHFLAALPVCEILDGALRLQQLRQRLAHLHVQLGGVQGVQELIALHPLSHRDPLVLDGAVEGALTVRVMSASSRPTRPRRRVSGSGRTRCQCVPGAVAGRPGARATRRPRRVRRVPRRRHRSRQFVASRIET